MQAGDVRILGVHFFSEEDRINRQLFADKKSSRF
jgi:hypothetical protein